MCILSEMGSIGTGSNEWTEIVIITEILMILPFACQNVVMRFTALLGMSSLQMATVITLSTTTALLHWIFKLFGYIT